MRILFYFRQCLFAMLAPITALASPYSVEVLADNPVAFYRFNETPGATVALDASPNGNHATYAGTVLPTLGITGLTEEADSAAEFSGSSTNKPHVLTPPLFNPALTSFTIEALFRTGATTQQAVVQQDGGLGRTLFFLSSSGGDIRSFLGGTTSSSGTSAIVGQVHHGALVFDDPTNTLTWYIDGVATATGTVNPESTNGGFFIGIHKNLTSNYFDGVIDEVAFYTDALSASRIAEHVASMETPPILNSFTGAPVSIPIGGNTTLAWEIAPEVTALSIDQGVGDVLPLTSNGIGNVSVSPATTTIYTITATTPNGTANETVTIYVDEPASFRLNEFAAQNAGPLADEDGDETDWIEIKNTGNTPNDLAGFYLTDDPTNLTKWQFPSTALNDDELLLVFASDKDRAVSGSELHTNFKLSSGGEYLALIEPDGVTIHDEFGPTYPPQYVGNSYGRLSDGNSGYFAGPTPAAENGTTTFSGFVEEEVVA
ncbi:lamin tail domain-containing protein, partial [Akkermansiaceae bacterium]|nr:lamin tail domain-containing protein [Akkermansiaceae bacterium]